MNLTKALELDTQNIFHLFFERRPVALLELVTTSRDQLFPVKEFLEIKEELQKIGLETFFSMEYGFTVEGQMQVSTQGKDQALVVSPLLTSTGNEQNLVSGQGTD